MVNSFSSKLLNVKYSGCQHFGGKREVDQFLYHCHSFLGYGNIRYAAKIYINFNKFKEGNSCLKYLKYEGTRMCLTEYSVNSA